MNIYCIEQNYLNHRREKENNIAGEIVIFKKPESGLYPSGEVYRFTDFDENKLYGQVELVLKISKGGKLISLEAAPSHYNSVTVGINFTSINIHDELNNIVVPWEKVKAWQGSSMVGNWLLTTDFSDKNDINFCLYKNREMVQLGNTELMIRDFDSIIAGISQQFTLEEGDIIFTGTPLGIGELFEDDKLELFIEDDTILEFEIAGE